MILCSNHGIGTENESIATLITRNIFEYKPKEDVDLLIDDVYGKYALDIVPGRRRRFSGGQLNKYQIMSILNHLMCFSYLSNKQCFGSCNGLSLLAVTD